MKKIDAKAMLVMLLSMILMMNGVAAAAEKTIDDYPISTTLEVVGAISETGTETISVTPGDYFMVVLYASGGTGYSWTLDSTNLNLAEAVAHTTGPVSNEPLAGGNARWKFCLRVKPEATGQETLHFSLSRPWMKNTKPARSFDLTIVAK